MSKYKVDISGIQTSQIKVLKPKEMRLLFEKYQKEGDEKAKEELVLGNMKLVLSLIQKYHQRTDNMDDLFQVGMIGLMKSIEHFDLNQNVQFSTYAVPMIVGEIKRYLRDNSYIHISRSLRDIAYRVLQEKENYIAIHHQEPTLSYLSEKLDIAEGDIIEAIQSMQPACSIFDEVKSNEGSKLCLIDQIPNKKDDMLEVNHYMDLHRALASLNDKEKYVIMHRYYEGKTQVELADELLISQAQISRIEKQALQQLHKYMK